MVQSQLASVLVVEDERIVARDMQETLVALGYDAFAIAASGDEALAAATTRRPDVVLMDIRIEGDRDGIETASVLRDRFDVPVIYVTAYADDATVERAKLTEPHAYLLKPIKSGELRSAIELSLYRHKMEKEARERERWFATTLSSIADAVVAVDLTGKVVFMNPVAESLTGVKAAAALGRPVQEILRLVDAHTAASMETPLQVALRESKVVMLADGALQNLETGALRSIGDSASPVVDGDRVLGAVMVFRDVTEQKKTRAQLELADRLTSLGTMAAGVAHEINNPLAAIVLTAELIAGTVLARRGALSRAGGASPADERNLAEISENIADLQSAAERIGSIVAELRHFGRPPMARPGPVDVAPAVDWAIRMTSNELKHRARLITDLKPVPLVEGDETKLGQVLVNLLINAAHSIPPGKASANEVRVATRTDDRGRAVIEVSDTGRGIPDEIKRRVFEPFFTTKPAGVGTGLGLSIVHGIVTAMGGEIQVESQPRRGTVVRVILPATAAAASGVRRATVQSAAPSRRTRVLVIDDDETILRVFRRALAEHDVVCCARADEALVLLEHGTTFDVIFSDVMMPNTTGPAFYDKLVRQFPELAPRVVFMSGGVMTAHDEVFLQSVSNQRLDKPFGVADLLDRMRRVVDAQD